MATARLRLAAILWVRFLETRPRRSVMIPRRSHLAENSTLKFVPGSRYGTPLRRHVDTAVDVLDCYCTVRELCCPFPGLWFRPGGRRRWRTGLNPSRGAERQTLNFVRAGVCERRTIVSGLLPVAVGPYTSRSRCAPGWVRRGRARCAEGTCGRRRTCSGRRRRARRRSARGAPAATYEYWRRRNRRCDLSFVHGATCRTERILSARPAARATPRAERRATPAPLQATGGAWGGRRARRIPPLGAARAAPGALASCARSRVLWARAEGRSLRAGGRCTPRGSESRSRSAARARRARSPARRCGGAPGKPRRRCRLFAADGSGARRRAARTARRATRHARGTTNTRTPRRTSARAPSVARCARGEGEAGGDSVTEAPAGLA